MPDPLPYPTAEESYEFTYRLGETSYFSERYEEAIPYYKWVRDHRELQPKPRPPNVSPPTGGGLNISIQ